MFCVTFLVEIISFVRGGPKTWKRAVHDRVPNLESYEMRASNMAGLGPDGWKPQFRTAYQQTQDV